MAARRARSVNRWLMAICAVGMGMSLPSAAWACGGFFCNNGQVMDQAGEEIFFEVDEEDGRVTAIIRIQYEGDAERFSWVLPLPSVPEISVSSEQVFRALRDATRPQFAISGQQIDCFGFGGSVDAASAPDEADASFGEPEPPPVVVYKSGQAGPFDYDVVGSDDPAALASWLADNSYDLPGISDDLIAHYTAQDMVFVAVRLSTGQSSGDIRPLSLTFEEQAPCVPLVLTQIAAVANMPIRLWIAASQRAIPRNWFHVEPNLKRLNWTDVSASSEDWWGAIGYTELANRAIDEAVGHGFITEYAGPADVATIWTPQLLSLDNLSSTVSASQFVSTLWKQPLWNFGSVAPDSLRTEVTSALEEIIPFPESAAREGIDPDAFYASPWAYERLYSEIPFDAADATSKLDSLVVEPWRKAQEILERQPNLTRIYSAVSPEEMNRDPVFGFTDALGDVEVVRSATAVRTCGETGDEVVVTLSNGDTYTWQGPESTVASERYATHVQLVVPGEAPVNVPPENVEWADSQLGVVSAELVIEALEAGDGEVSSPPGFGVEPAVDQPIADEAGSGSGGGCSSAAGTAIPWAIVFGFIGLALGVRRIRE